MPGTDVLMGDQGLVSFANAGAVTGSDGLTSIVNSSTYDINGWRARASRRVFPSTPMGGSVIGMERVAVSRRKSVRGQIRIQIKAGGDAPRLPCDTKASLILTFITGKTWTFDAYLVEAEASADSLVAGPQEVVYDFVSTGTVEMTVAL